MSARLLTRFALAIMVIGATRPALADGPIVSVDVGATIPVSKFQRHASEGGAISVSGGYQFDLLPGFALALLATPQFATFSSPDCGTDPNCNEDLASIFSMTAGPRFSLYNDRTELYFSAAGGYYRGIHGPIDQEAGGFSLTGGLNYEICRGSSLGLFIRRDEANMDVEPQSGSNLQFLTAGLAFQHRYGAPQRECIQFPSFPTGELMIGVDFGMAIPVDRVRKQVDLGANIAPFVGYRFNLGRGFGLALIGQPQFTAFPSSTCDPNDEALERCIDGDEWSGLVGITAGPRLSYNYSSFEGYLGGQGGYYTEVNGPFEGDGAGFNVEAGAGWEFRPGTALSIFVRYDDTDIHVNRTNSGDVLYTTFGFGLQHRFLAPEPAPPAPSPAPQPEPTPAVKRKIILRGVNFEFDRYDLRPDAKPILDEAVAVLEQEENINLIVEGHTDSRGTEEYNEGLSLRRAQTVYDYFVAAGIDPLRMRVRGYGELRPVASNDTDDGRAQNRRVELQVEQRP